MDPIVAMVDRPPMRFLLVDKGRRRQLHSVRWIFSKKTHLTRKG